MIFPEHRLADFIDLAGASKIRIFEEYWLPLCILGDSGGEAPTIT